MPTRVEVLPPKDAQKRRQEAKRIFSELDGMDEALRMDVLNGSHAHEVGPCGAFAACLIAGRLGLEKDVYWSYFARMNPYSAYREMLEVLQLPVGDRYREMAERTGEDGRVSG